ncbi:unnamed protein product [Alopecurus aequalis]
MDSGDAAWRSRAVCGTEYTCCRAAPGGTGTALHALRLSRVGTAAAEAAVRSLQTAHPVLRAHLCGSSSSPTLAFPPSSSPQLSLEPQPSALDFHSLLEREINRNPWAAAEHGPNGVPVLFVALYELPGGGAALFVLIHTVVCDRAASEALLTELLALLAGDDPEVKEEAAAVEAGLEKRIPKKDARKPLWARGVDMVGYSINGLRTSTLPFQDTGTARSTQMVRLGFGRDDTTRLMDACKENGVKLSSAMAAAILLAVRLSKKLDSGQQETYSVATMINCRQFLEPPLDDHNVGFFHSAIANTHKMNREEELWALARRCHDSYSNAKNNKKHLTDIRDLNFLMCRAIENPQLTLRTGLVTVFEEPVTHDTSDLQSRAGVEDYVYGLTMHGAGPSIAVFDSIRDGQLRCACMYPSPLHSRKQMQEIFDKVKLILVQGSTAMK